ncbi:MAG: hypothetical protein QOE66_672 [Chloroflexota bacterium]|jgi:hypothetical protein|nr:hypothetical protein [Chloroflexota bacterium]
MVVLAGRHAPAVWLWVCTIQVSWALGWNDPVNPALTQAARALASVMPTSFGTVLQVGVGVGVGRGVGRGVGLGVAPLVGLGVATGAGVGAGVGTVPGGGVAPVNPPVGFGIGVIVAVPCVALGLPPGEPTAADVAPALAISPGDADRAPLPVVEGNPLPRVRISARTRKVPIASNAPTPRGPIAPVRPATPTAGAAAAAIGTAPPATYGKAHSGQSPEASAQHHRHAYDLQYGQ